MTMRTALISVLMAALSSLALAADKPPGKASPVAASQAPLAPPPSVPANMEACAALTAKIEASEKEMAWIKASGVVDNSAPRETTRLLSKLAEQQMQSQNLMVMVAMRCPVLPVAEIAGGDRYQLPALECYLAFQKKGAQAGEPCVRRNWQPHKSTPSTAASEPAQ